MSYDQWKTASPYDDIPDVEGYDTNNDACPACDETLYRAYPKCAHKCPCSCHNDD